MWQGYTELYKKDLNDPDNHDGVFPHLESYILEGEVKQALGGITTNKAGGGDGIQVELFQILIDDTVNVLQSMCQQIWKSQQWPQDWKNQFSFQSQRQYQRMFRLLHNYTHLTQQQKNAQNSPSKALTVCNLRTFNFSSCVQKRKRNQRTNCQHLLNPRKSKRIPEKHLLLLF